MKADVYVDSGVPVIRGTNISEGRGFKGDWVYVTEEFAKGIPNCLLHPGDLVFPHRGSIGAVALIEATTGPMVLSTSMMKFRPNSAMADSTFLYYFFRSAAGRQEILKFSSQVGTPGIGQPLSSLRQFRVPLPAISLQRSISRILSTLDENIELNRRTNETLGGMARALFKDWFVDFGPIRAKQGGLEPFLAPELWSLFPARLDAEGKPEGWRIEPLMDHARLISGGTPKTDTPAYWNGGISWASAKDVSQCGEPFLIATERTITQRGLEESATRLIPTRATVVVARGATTGRYCMAGNEMAMNQTCYALSSAQGHSFWLNCAFGALVEDLVNSAHGSVFDTITTKTIERARVMIPTNRLIERFQKMVEPVFLRVLANIEQSRTLAQTRDLLLPKLMSGEVRAQETEPSTASAPQNPQQR